jgi:hypothetical protein
MDMDYDDIDVERVVDAVIKAEEQGKLRPATKWESMAVRLAALSSIVHEMQAIVTNELGDAEFMTGYMCQKAEGIKDPAAVALGRKGGAVTSAAKASKENGKMGGRPRRFQPASH